MLVNQNQIHRKASIMLEIKEVSKTYHAKDIDYPVLKGISSSISDGEFVAVMGRPAAERRRFSMLFLVSSMRTEEK